MINFESVIFIIAFGYLISMIKKVQLKVVLSVIFVIAAGVFFSRYLAILALGASLSMVINSPEIAQRLGRNKFIALTVVAFALMLVSLGILMIN